jgi:hypothetical protein
MCDYSLMAIPNRLAVSGEELIVYRFEAGSVSLASALKLRRIQECRKAQCHGFWPTIKAFFIPSQTRSIPAICIPPGARLLTGCETLLKWVLMRIHPVPLAGGMGSGRTEAPIVTQMLDRRPNAGSSSDDAHQCWRGWR